MLSRPAARAFSAIRHQPSAIQPQRRLCSRAQINASLFAARRRRPVIANDSFDSVLRRSAPVRGVKYLGREWTWLELLRFTWQTEPYQLSFTVAFIALLAAAAGGVLWSQYRIDDKFGTYPKSVGKKLRDAIYYTKTVPDPERAVRLYVQALEAAGKAGLDPMSDEVIGIKTECANCLDLHGNPQSAIKLFEEVKQSCLKWIDEHGSEQESAARRTKMLSWACRVSTRLADLYANKYVGNEQKMEESLVWAVETTLKEKRRRETEGVRPDEGDWLDDDELGSQLETLAHFYLKKDRHFFASQLFLNALNIKPEKDCHAVTLMNNLAISMAEQAPPVEPGTPPASPAQLRESGRAWARQAIALAQKIEPPERNEECDRGCVAATHNLGEFAEMDGNIEEARRRYEEAGSIAHAIGYEEGMIEADAGLKRLGGSGQAFKRKGWW